MKIEYWQIPALRNALGLSQGVFASKVKITQSLLSKMESGVIPIGDIYQKRLTSAVSELINSEKIRLDNLIKSLNLQKDYINTFLIE